MFGTSRNYIVAECEFVEGEGIEEETDPVAEAEPAEKDEEGQEDKEETLPPKPNYKSPHVIPKEEFGTGCNKKVYFVCNDGEFVVVVVVVVVIIVVVVYSWRRVD